MVFITNATGIARQFEKRLLSADHFKGSLCRNVCAESSAKTQPTFRRTAPLKKQFGTAGKCSRSLHSSCTAAMSATDNRAPLTSQVKAAETSTVDKENSRLITAFGDLITCYMLDLF